jgi:hypothetical protein
VVAGVVVVPLPEDAGWLDGVVAGVVPVRKSSMRSTRKVIERLLL